MLYIAGQLCKEHNPTTSMSFTRKTTVIYCTTEEGKMHLTAYDMSLLSKTLISSEIASSIH